MLIWCCVIGVNFVGFCGEWGGVSCDRERDTAWRVSGVGRTCARAAEAAHGPLPSASARMPALMI